VGMCLGASSCPVARGRSSTNSLSCETAGGNSRLSRLRTLTEWWEEEDEEKERPRCATVLMEFDHVGVPTVSLLDKRNTCKRRPSAFRSYEVRAVPSHPARLRAKQARRRAHTSASCDPGARSAPLRPLRTEPAPKCDRDDEEGDAGELPVALRRMSSGSRGFRSPYGVAASQALSNDFGFVDWLQTCWDVAFDTGTETSEPYWEVK